MTRRLNHAGQNRLNTPFRAGLFLTGLLLVAAPLTAAPPRALPDGAVPEDIRLGTLKDLNGYFPFHVPGDTQQWTTRATALRQQILVSQGLWPLPTKVDLQAVVHGRRDQGDYTIEKVYFESMPGFFVTGNLYRPKQRQGPMPGVLCPHGHWSEGRFYDCGGQAVREQIVQGAERFEEGGRSPMQSRCVQLARMGCVVFHYDMIGYADSQQLSSALVHRFSKQRPEMNSPDNWGLFSPQAESRLQSAMGLQTYNSIRSLDFLLELPDVDPQQIAITGASGGGTQTFMLAAVDPRVAVAFPAVMVSTAMQGGCTCENACCLRVGTGNVEMAALLAAKPLGMTAANDWTVEMATKGFPELQQLYKLLGQPDNVSLTALTHFGHNYNYASRAAMYKWLNRHLHLGQPEPIVEEDYQRLSRQELTVWEADHPQPPGGDDFERQLVQWWDRDSCQQLDALLPQSAAQLATYQETIRRGIAAIVGRALPDPDHLELQIVTRVQQDDCTHVACLLTYHLPPRLASGANQQGRTEHVQEQIPLLVFQPAQPSGRSCILLTPEGKSGLFDEQGHLRAPLRTLLAAGTTLWAPDLLYQGEFLADGQVVDSTRRVENPREAAAYTFGYNPTLFAHRTHDVLTLMGLVRSEPDLGPGTLHLKELDLAGLGYTGPIAAVAAGLVPDAVDRLAVDQANFRFAAVDQIHSPMFLPGGAKYHDLPGVLALTAPKNLWLAHSQDMPSVVRTAYTTAQAEQKLQIYRGGAEGLLDAMVQWLQGL